MTVHQANLKGTGIVKTFQLKKSPASPSGILTAVDDVQIEIRKGETVGIAGESGCGKSTMGKILAGLIAPDKGEIVCNGTPVRKLTPSGYALFRRKTQMIFQDPFSSLNPRMRIGDIIGEPLLIAGESSGESRRTKVENIMKKVGLTPEQINRFPHEFSGGQRQRIGIARALAATPEIIIADEPVSSLDISIQAQIINLLQEMKKEFDLSMVIISHDLSVLRHICDHVNIMYLGSIVESGPAGELFSNYQHPYTEALVAAIPSIKKGEKKISLLKDDLPSPLDIPSGCRFHTRCRYAEAVCTTVPPPLEEKYPGQLAACHFSQKIFGSR